MAWLERTKRATPIITNTVNFRRKVKVCNHFKTSLKFKTQPVKLKPNKIAQVTEVIGQKNAKFEERQ